MPSHDSDNRLEQAETQAEPTIEEPVVLPIEAYLDLHTFQPSEVKELLDDYLRVARDHGFQEVLIIHGKGQGILRKRVRTILGAHPQVASFRDAEPDRGGWGATVARLVSVNPEDTLVTLADPSEDASSSVAIHPAAMDEASRLHRLSRSQLLIGCMLGMALGTLFYQVLVSLGADSMPALILPYGLCISYGLIRKADNLAHVVRRITWAGVVLGGLWLAGQLLRRIAFG